MLKKLTRPIGVCVLIMLLCASCGTAPAGPDEIPGVLSRPPAKADTIEKDLLFGIAEPNVFQALPATRSADAAKLVQSVGAKSYLNWISLPDTFIDNYSIKPGPIIRHRDYINELTMAGVQQIVYVGDGWHMPPDLAQYTDGALPPRNMTVDSDYMKFLESYQLQWEALGANLINIDYWQIGYELDRDENLHPIEYLTDKAKVFTQQQKADIITDMLFAATKGLLSSNVDSKVVLTGISGEGFTSGKTAEFISLIYKNIASGQFGGGSTKTKDYFRVLAWNPVIDGAPDDAWVAANQAIYELAKQNGDGHKKAFLTKFGYAGGDGQGQWLVDAYKLAAEKLPFVECMMTYRLFEDDTALTDAEKTQGLFTRALSPKTAAQTLQTAYEGQGDLAQYAVSAGKYARGANLAADATVKASSSCEHSEYTPPWGLDFINDGITYGAGWTNFYEANETQAVKGVEWLEFRLPVKTTVNRVNLFPRNMSDYSGGDFPRAFQILVSDDGKSWKEVGSYKLNMFGKNMYEYTFAAVTAGYVKINVTEMPPSGGDYDHVSFCEVEIIKA